MICPRCGEWLPKGERCVCGYTEPSAPPEAAPPSQPSLADLEKQLALFQSQLTQLTDQSRGLQRQIEQLRKERQPDVSPPKVTVPVQPGAEQKPSPDLAPPPSVPIPPPRTFQPKRPKKPLASVLDSLSGSASRTREWEVLVGGNWLLKVGVVALVLGALYFLKYAFDHQWIGNTGRVLIGVFSGLSLVYGGEAFQRRGYRIYGQSLSGGGIAILYLSIYAAFNFYALIPQGAAFVLMALVTAACGVLAHRHASVSLAVLGLLGGLLTPYWLRTGVSNQVGLLTYVLILDIGYAALAWRRGWFFLNWLSFVGTVLLFAGWAGQHYQREARWTTETFLVLLAAAFLAIGAFERKRKEGRVKAYSNLLAALTVLLFFFSSQIVLFDVASYYWGFLILFSLLFLGYGLRSASNAVNEGWLALVGLGIFIWLVEGYELADRALTWAGSTTLFVMVTAQAILRHQRRTGSGGATRSDFRLCLSAGLGFYGVTYFLLSGWDESHADYSDWLGLLAIAQGVLHLVLARVVLRSQGGGRLLVLGHAAAAVMLAALAVPIQFDQNWVTIGWAVQAVILAQIGFTVNWEKLRWAAAVLLGLSLFRLILLDAWEPLRQYQLLLNRRAFTFIAVIAAVYLLSWVYQRQSDTAVRLFTRRGTVDGLLTLASFLTVFLLSQEVWFYYREQLSDLYLAFDRETVTESQFDQSLRETFMARQVGLSVVWAAYSVLASLAGIFRRRAALRLFGMALFLVTILKVFWLDIWALQQFYRIISVIALGLFLLVVAFLYQRYRSWILGSPATPEDEPRSS